MAIVTIGIGEGGRDVDVKIWIHEAFYSAEV